MAIDAGLQAGSGTETPKSNALFSAIVGTVAAHRGRRLTVRDIAGRLGTSASVTARCIALHKYFNAHATDRMSLGTLEFPLPHDMSIPTEDEEIDEQKLGLFEFSK